MFEIVVLDAETTGFKDTDIAIQTAWVKYSLDTPTFQDGSGLGLLEEPIENGVRYFANPLWKRSSPEAESVHKISYEELMEHVGEFHDSIADVHYLFDHNVIVGWNVDFDINKLRYTLGGYWVKNEGARWPVTKKDSEPIIREMSKVDVMRIYCDLFKGQKEEFGITRNGRAKLEVAYDILVSKVPGFTQEYLMESFKAMWGEDVEFRHHDARVDIFKTVVVYNVCISLKRQQLGL